ncbi:MAG: YciI family protein [Pirellulaceae bacterium]
MKFICLGYADPEKWSELPPGQQEAWMEECFAYDDELRRGGHFLGGEALQWAHQAVTLRRTNGSLTVTDGPFAETKEQLGGILILEADDMPHAVALMSKHPGVRFGPFEIRPADEEANRLIEQRGKVFLAEPSC